MRCISIILFAVFVFSCLAYAVDDPALVFYCPFDEGSGDTTSDIVSGLVGEINGPVWSADGKIGGCLEFVAAADNVEFPADTVLDITEGLTIEAWVYPIEVQADSGIMGRRNVGNQGGYCLQWTNGMFEMWLHKGGWQGSRNLQAMQPDVETWHHVAAVFTGDKGIQYVNGEVDAEYPVAAPIDSVDEVFRIGNAQTGLSSMFGFIDEVAVYSRALTADEVRADMEQGVLAPVSPVGSLATTWAEVRK